MGKESFEGRLAGWVQRNKWQLLILFAGVLLPLALFGTLAEDVVEKVAFRFDEPLLLFLHAHNTPLRDQVMLFFSLVGYRFGVLPAEIIIAVVLLARRRWGDAFFWVLATGGAALLNVLAKTVFGRVRPDLWLSIAPEIDFSFPSGHATLSMSFVAAAVVLAWPTRWRWPVLALGVPFVVLVGLSRMYLGVHFPSDILAGWLASLAWVLGVSLILYGRLTKPTERTEPAQKGDDHPQRPPEARR